MRCRQNTNSAHLLCRYAGVLFGGLVGRTTERVAQLDSHARTPSRPVRALLHLVTLHAVLLGLHAPIFLGSPLCSSLVLSSRLLFSPLFFLSFLFFLFFFFFFFFLFFFFFF